MSEREREREGGRGGRELGGKERVETGEKGRVR